MKSYESADNRLSHAVASKMFGTKLREHEGKLWLVPEWNDTLDGKWTTPTRIICLEGLPVEKQPFGGPVDLALEYPITKSILGGQIPPKSTHAFVIVENPHIEIQRGGGESCDCPKEKTMDYTEMDADRWSALFEHSREIRRTLKNIEAALIIIAITLLALLWELWT